MLSPISIKVAEKKLSRAPMTRHMVDGREREKLQRVNEGLAATAMNFVLLLRGSIDPSNLLAEAQRGPSSKRR